MGSMSSVLCSCAPLITDDVSAGLPEQLSPVRVPSLDLDQLPFGLTWDDVAVALPDFAGNGTAHVSYRKRGRHQGGHPSMIITLRYDASDGCRHDRTLFLKRNPDDAREADAYHFFAAGALPVPELAVCTENEGGEVLGLEFLPSIGIEHGDVDDLLRVVATLNAVTDAPETVAALTPGLPQADFEELLAEALDHIAKRWPRSGSIRWLDLYRKAVQATLSLPQALTHGELAAQQIGRTENGQVVMFDLATVGMRPRFADVANLVQELKNLTGRDERSLVHQYLRHLSQVGGPICAVEEVWPELELTRFVQELEALPWRINLDADDLHRHVATVEDLYPTVLALVDS